MTCNEALNRYMALDKHEAVPVMVTVHLLRCKRCRTIVRAMTKAAYMYSAPFAEAVSQDNSLMQKTMSKITDAMPDLMKLQAEKYALQEVHILPWVLVGTIMIIGLAAVPFTVLGRWAAENFRLSFIIPFALVFAIFVSVFSALFVGRNLDFFIKKFDLSDTENAAP